MGKCFHLLALHLWGPCSTTSCSSCDQEQDHQVAHLLQCAVPSFLVRECPSDRSKEGLKPNSAPDEDSRVEHTWRNMNWAGDISVSTFACLGGPLSATLKEQARTTVKSSK